MIDIKKEVAKPSKALQFMIDGLRRQDERPTFFIDMDVYGETREYYSIRQLKYFRATKKNTCFGCAATCAIQEIASKNLTKRDMHAEGRAHKLGYSYLKMREFEKAIDYARGGYLRKLFNFFALEFSNVHREKFQHRISLSTLNWREDIPQVEKLIMELYEAGL